MDTYNSAPETIRPGPITCVLARLAGVDVETLAACPQHDWGCVRATAMLFIAVWVYQATILSIVAHQLFAPDGAIHPALVLGGMFLATMVLLIDSFVFLRAGYHADGIAELLRGGIDLGGGYLARLKALVFLALRILLSAALAQITAIFVGLIIFRGDLDADAERRFQQENKALIETARLHVDAEIQRATDAEKAASDQLTILQQQVDAARDGVVDPIAGDTGVRAEQDEVRQLLAEKQQRDSELIAAQSYATAELAGEPGPGLSGIPGRGPRRRAAEERVQDAIANDQAAARSLDEARRRLDDLRAKVATNGGDRVGRAQSELPELENDLLAQAAEVVNLRRRLTDLTDGRDDAIRSEVENAPEFVGHDRGILTQLSDLKQIAQNDREIAAVILLIDLTSFGLELAAVLAKVTTFIPTTYAALLARNSYMRLVDIVDDMEQELNQRAVNRVVPDDRMRPGNPANGSSDDFMADDFDPDVPFAPGPPTAPANGHASNGGPVKRPRGRPRKSTFN